MLVLIPFTSISKNIEQDSIKVAINDIRIVNKAFRSLDLNTTALNTYKKIYGIQSNIITTDNSIIDTYKLVNVNTNKQIEYITSYYENEVNKYKVAAKRNKIILVGVIGLSLLIIVK